METLQRIVEDVAEVARKVSEILGNEVTFDDTGMFCVGEGSDRFVIVSSEYSGTLMVSLRCGNACCICGNQVGDIVGARVIYCVLRINFGDRGKFLTWNARAQKTDGCGRVTRFGLPRTHWD